MTKRVWLTLNIYNAHIVNGHDKHAEDYSKKISKLWPRKAKKK